MTTTHISKELEQLLLDNGYFALTIKPKVGICGLRKLLFTVGLFYGLDGVGYKGRYCYHSSLEALEALAKWDGSIFPPGNWIVHKGPKGDFYNQTTKQNNNENND